MACPRCGGLLVPDEMVAGIYHAKTLSSCSGYRCVNCGYMEDPVMRANRRSCVITGPAGLTTTGRTKRIGQYLRGVCIPFMKRDQRDSTLP